MTTSKKQAGVAAFLLVLVALLGSGFTDKGQSGGAQAETKVYLGFDRNEHPGDAPLPVLRKSFSFAGYWLTPPPRTLQNSCVGKRKILKEQGLGFLLLARGRSASTTQSDPTENGIADAREAVRNAPQEGFVTGSVVFLDIEEGGRLPPQFHAYLRFRSMNWNATDSDRGVYSDVGE